MRYTRRGFGHDLLCDIPDDGRRKLVNEVYGLPSALQTLVREVLPSAEQELKLIEDHGETEADEAELRHWLLKVARMALKAQESVPLLQELSRNLEAIAGSKAMAEAKKPVVMQT